MGRFSLFGTKGLPQLANTISPEPGFSIGESAMGSDLIRCLHLSDFHVGKDELGERQFFKYIHQHVRDRVQNDRPPDLIFITGDIAHGGLRGQYEEFSKNFFQPLISATGLDPTKHVVIVPRNHDVDRDKADSRKLHGLLEQNTRLLDPIKEGKAAREKFRDQFRTFADFDPTRSGKDAHWFFSCPGALVKPVEVKGYKLGILGVHAAWLSWNKFDRHELTPGKNIRQIRIGTETNRA